MPPIKMSLEEYFALEASSQERYEYHDGRVVAMAGGSRKHGLITMNIGAALYPLLRDKPCEAISNEMRVKISSRRRYVYPDIVIACGQPHYELINGLETLLNPTVIIEVLSPSTEHYDRIEKFIQYQALESLQEYILVSQEEALIEHRLRDGDKWILTFARGLDATLELPSIGAQLALADGYLKIEFEAQNDEEPPIAP